MNSNIAMLPVSGRLPEDLYLWLSSLTLEGATTFSDKLRQAIATLKRLREGGGDYAGALALQRDLSHQTLKSVAAIDHETGMHSEVLAVLLEGIPAMCAAIQSACLADRADAQALERTLTRRTLQLAETLLRQMTTQDAAAYDPNVVVGNASRLVELAQRVSSRVDSKENNDD